MSSKVCKILGENIKRIRHARGITQSQLADMLNIDVKSLSLIETGKGFISSKTLDKLIDILKISLQEFFKDPIKESADSTYKKVISNVKLIKNNPQKLHTLDLILESMI